MIHRNDHVDDRSSRAYYTRPMVDNRPAWVIRFENALTRGDQCYREAADTLVEAMRVNDLNQKEAAQYIGKSATWVCRLLGWRESGCPGGGPFASEIAARRDSENTPIATSQSSHKQKATLEDLGQLSLPLLGGYSDYVPGQADATLNAISLMDACRIFLKAAASMRSQNASLAFRSAPISKRRATLARLAVRLSNSIDAAASARNELRKALKTMPKLGRGAA